ncbi:MAG: FAD-dependent oxidoreductase [Rhodobacteraceae bacterium]|nr:MAG: FAD-dependent oxidoreductase [Paracoccaceae bacterium]
MNISAHPPSTRNIAIIGAGISGMGAAFALAQHHNVTLYESGATLGGHARTKIAGRNGDQPVDTGFIVFNYANYPNLTRLFETLDVPVCESNMSFGASLQGGKIEYALANFGAMFAQKKNLLNPKFLRMIADILRFNARGLKASRDTSMTVRDLLVKLGTGDWFRDYYLLPLSGAIWSTPVEQILDFPAYAMMNFFENHALLSHTGQHQWYTVSGGSVEYVRRLQAALERRGVDIRLKTAVKGVSRNPVGVSVQTAEAPPAFYDEVVFATHSDDSLRLLEDATDFEHEQLSAVQYQPNEMILHADPSVMPHNKQCWSSWVYSEAADKTSNRIDLTYWMNSLQPIPKDDPHFVTLNTTRTIKQELIYDQATFRHPVYDLAALQAQQNIAAQNGKNHTWFCGAWMKNGFHEDGLSSALDVATAIEEQTALRVAAE